MSDLAGKKIVVTGAAGGIGLATSKLAASLGASVLAVDNDAAVEDTAALIRADGGHAEAVRADVSDENDVAGFVAECVNRFGNIDGLHANAGIIGADKPFRDLTPEDWQRTLGINLVGTFLCVKHVAAHLVAQKSGAIVCTASVAGLRANAGPVDYSASKAGVISMTQTIAYELYGTGVRINAVCPGLIETGMTESIFTNARERGTEARIGQVNPSARHGTPDEIAEMACFLLSDAASYVNGQAFPVDGGLSASHPWVYPQGKG
jgi:NAD(P)-dependent dehydrogenase (short-subunit alcohol dehydrogenase family)